jgi:hypothetical protein
MAIPPETGETTMPRKIKAPVIGPAFASDFTNDAGRASSYASELRYYRPRGFSKLAAELDALSRRLDTDKARPNDADALFEAMDEADTLLTEYARRVLKHDYVWFGMRDYSGDGSVGFWYDIDHALDDADLQVNAGDSVPTGFSGMVAFVTDHGNVTIQNFSRGRMTRELFSVV